MEATKLNLNCLTLRMVTLENERGRRDRKKDDGCGRGRLEKVELGGG